MHANIGSQLVMVKHKFIILSKANILGKYLTLIFLRLEENSMNYKANANNSIGSKVRTSYEDIRIYFMLAIIEESTVSDCLTGPAFVRKDEACAALLIVLRISSSSVCLAREEQLTPNGRKRKLETE